MGLSQNPCTITFDFLPTGTLPCVYIKGGLNEKALLSFPRQNVAIQCRMLLSVREKADPLCSALLCHHLPELTVSKDDQNFSKTVLQTIMLLVPWENETALPTRIHDLVIANGEVLQRIYELLLENLVRLK